VSALSPFKPEGYAGGLLYLLTVASVFVAGVWAWRAASTTFDRLFLKEK
jgi:hypothetical protein